ncbi:MAG: hypothetical protein WD231_00730 [Candidatus Woykebacteria bacterium]
MSELFKFFVKSKKSRAFAPLKKTLEQKRKDLLAEFKEKHEQPVKWLEDKGLDIEEIAKKGSKSLAASAFVGAVLLGSGATADSKPTPAQGKVLQGSEEKIKEVVKVRKDPTPEVKRSLSKYLPRDVRSLSRDEERKIDRSLSEAFGFRVATELSDHRLNTSYGTIAIESHLTRYPGETLSEHFSSPHEAAIFGRFGMAGGPGAFGYMAPTRRALSQEAIQREKYYVAIQTFLIPGWSWQPNTAAWYKHHKVIVIDPRTGKSVVGSIAESGPEKNTGRAFGGSPELMYSLGLGADDAALILFVDDPKDDIRLGPV